MRGNPFYFGGFTGGLNTRDAAYDVEATQARDLSNVLGTTHGAMRKREGNVTFATPAAAMLSLFAIEVLSTKYLIGQASTKWYSLNGAGAPTDITGPNPPTAGLRWACVQAPASPVGGQGPVYLANGVDAPQQWTGAGVLADWTAVAGNLPNGQHMVAAANHIYVAGMSAYTPFGGTALLDPGSALVWCAPGDPRSWPAINYQEFDPGDGDAITGLGTVGPYLLVFKRRKVFVVTDLETGAYRRISEGTGCIAARSIVETPMGTMFLALDRGVYVTKGSNVELISDVIRPTFDAIPAGLRANATAAFTNNHYYLSTSLISNTVPDVTLDYDLELQSWWKHSFAANQFAVWRATNTQQLFAAPPVARVDECLVPNVFQDNAANYPAYWLGAWQSPSYFRRKIIQTPDFRKRLRGVRFDASGKFALYLAKDFAGEPSLIKNFDFTGAATLFGGSGSFGGSGFFGDAPGVQQGRAPTPGGVARAFSLKWASDASSAVGWELENYVLLMQDRKD